MNHKTFTMTMTSARFILLMFFIFLSTLAYPQERIVNYDVDIQVNKDRSLFITEFIKVNAEGIYIRRGITRDLPTTRVLGDHGEQTVFYDIQEVLKDGEPVNYQSKKEQGDVTLYIGSADVFIPSGLHEYTIKYKVKNQIAFFDDFDELYWNVIGTNNRFSVDNANVRIILPAEANIQETHIYGGMRGEQQELTNIKKEDNVISLQTFEKLNAFEGITASVAMDKGLFKEPSFFETGVSAILLVISLLALLAYFLLTWSKYGRDPESPLVEPVYGPPENLSPASCGYILSGFPNQRFTIASIMSLINNGHIHIEELSKTGIFASSRFYQLTNISKRPIAVEEQAELHRKLFARRKTVRIDGEYEASVKSALSSHNSSLRSQYSAFVNEGNNTQFIFLPILWIIVTTALVALTYYYEPYTEYVKLPILILYPIFCLIILAVYAFLIRKPTVEKLELRAKIKGFKEYLSWTEKDYAEGYDMEMRDIEHFEKLLPYAKALGVADKWQTSFESMINEAKLNDHPYYGIYMSPHFNTGFGQTLRGTATQPSSSSSGSGGGGFSGGGGGGGGVGGW